MSTEETYGPLANVTKLRQKQEGAPEQAAITKPLTISQWCARDIPEPDFLLGAMFCTTSRSLLVAATGLGKTNFALAAAFAMADGAKFLHWNGRDRAARVVYVDGEMSNRLMKRRIRDAVRRHHGAPASLFVLCRADHPDMPPLNTPEGQAFIDRYIAAAGGADFVWFDNIQALLLGSMIEEEPWQQTLPWIRSLTDRSIGQCWIHHAGHDKTRGYGTSTREWQMDAVAVMEAIERPDADIAFQVKLTKARERTPENRDDFASVNIVLANDAWQFERADQTQAKPTRLTTTETGWSRDLVGIFAEQNAPTEMVSPASGLTKQNCLTRDHIRDRLKDKGKFTLTPDGKLTGADRQKMSSALNTLKDKGKIGLSDRYVWLLQERQ